MIQFGKDFQNCQKLNVGYKISNKKSLKLLNVALIE